MTQTKVVGRLPKVHVPARPQDSSTPPPAIKIEDEEEFNLLGNAPSQFHAVSKVFEATRLIFLARSALELTVGCCRWATLDCLQVLEMLQETVNDFVSNTCIGGWEPTMPHVKFSQVAVHDAVWELYHVAKSMADVDQEVAVLEHAARWAMVLIQSGIEFDATEHGEGTSELQEGIFGFVK
ncbi:hypothetical protein HBI81_192520 [Parastagonospora nodorum]|nr:hypothetical protein HBI09_187340 [Parastagonospora nodorum]KAH4059892.1 hypothetical protein HBH49_025470 [Parastagonospora nodorum]KAH4087270.1 hypothetical protein HBH46_201340 [Parastagonospora nodorum]KAH4115592.1 hypothetical protein HBH47_178820 [Parastagonospora nodorum]KAH4183468.1 hypothetical protein HBH42_204910 [Parastagonospora nodorum]